MPAHPDIALNYSTQNFPITIELVVLADNEYPTFLECSVPLFMLECTGLLKSVTPTKPLQMKICKFGYNYLQECIDMATDQ